MIKISAWVRWLGLLFAALTLTIACSNQAKISTTTPTAETSVASPALVSATNNWIGHSGHYVAVDQGLFTEAGLKVDALFFQSASEMMTAFMAGKADLAWVTTGDAIQIAEKDPSVKIVYLIDYSNGADGIVGRNIKSPSEIKGKTVARENILFEKVLLQAYLDQAGLTEQDLKVSDMVAADAATAFVTKQVDAAVTYEPYLTKAVQEGEGSLLFTTKDTNLIADAVVVHTGLIETRKADLQTYFKVVDKAVKLVNSGDPEALKVAGDRMGVTVDEVKAQLTGVKLFDIEGNKTIAFNQSDPNNIMGNLELTTKVAIASKIIAEEIDPQSLYDASVVESL